MRSIGNDLMEGGIESFLQFLLSLPNSDACASSDIFNFGDRFPHKNKPLALGPLEPLAHQIGLAQYRIQTTTCQVHVMAFNIVIIHNFHNTGIYPFKVIGIGGCLLHAYSFSFQSFRRDFQARAVLGHETGRHLVIGIG